ncbi:hypothetical protein MNBD_GAMMA05-884 [hydrothermal vent metagenome]|uniref:Uncharacterized protein n=1 Tax=hydrothermal vent metagenome TaxID=652676 RepID=A0A3B0W5C0_9ZZZZ
MRIKNLRLLTSAKPLAFAISTALSIGVSTQAYAEVGDKLGTEFLVNTVTAEEKQEPAIATNEAGNSVITWSSRNQASANGGYDIYAQRYDTNGAKTGNEFLVNIVGSGDKNTPDVAMDANGNFVIVWRSNLQDGDGFGIYGQRYNTSGVKINSEFLVNTNIVDNQESPKVAMDADGDFVVTWQSFSAGIDYDIHAQRYSADGNVISGEITINTEINDEQSNPSIAMNTAGDFVVSWQGVNQALGGFDIYKQQYQANGLSVGGEVRVNTTTNNNQLNPSIAMDASGAFVIAWDSLGQEPLPATSGGSTQLGVYAQRFDAAGNTVGTDFLVNTETTDSQSNPSIAMNADGDFVVSWQSENQTAAVNGVYDVYAQRFSNDGNSAGSEFLVNTEIEDNQSAPVVAINGNGEFLIAWQSNNQVLGGVIDIYAQRYEGKVTSTLPTTTNESNGGGGGALSWLMGTLLLPFIFGRRRKTNSAKI